MDKNFCNFSFVLDTFVINEAHTGELTKNLILDCLDNWGLKDIDLAFATTDKGSNMVSGLSLLNDTKSVTHIICFSHSLHNYLGKIY